MGVIQERLSNIRFGGKLLNAAYIDQNDLRGLFRDLDKVARKFKDFEWRREIMKDPAKLVQNNARKRQNAYDGGPHYYYKNRKKGSRRKRGDAINDRVKILPGHLRLSIRHLEKLKKTPSAVIGPNIKRRLGNIKNLGRGEKNTSGFYAWMSKKEYRSADDFRKAIMEPALAQSRSAIVRHLERQRDKRLAQTKTQTKILT